MSPNPHTLRIVYMGTPDFAVAPLKALLDAGYHVVGVITMPDKPVGRHQSRLSQSPVKEFALAHDIPVLQPEKLKDPAFLDELRALRADLQVVVAFRMLPEVVWAMPRLGTFNLHAALLPQYRGAAPINWAVINGDTRTGVTTFFLDHDIDTGRIIASRETPIGPEDTAGIVHDRLMEIGSELVVDTVRLIEEGKADTTEQHALIDPDTPLRPAPKLFRETCRIDWSQPLAAIHNLIRGLSPYPAAWTTLTHDGHTDTVKIYGSKAEPADDIREPVGTVLTDGRTYLKVACHGGYLHLTELQLAGKRRMATADLLRGMHLAEGTALSME